MQKLIPSPSVSNEDKAKAQSDREKKYGIKAKEDARLSPPENWSMNEDDYGDPVNLAYPFIVDGESNVRSAAQRFSQFGFSGYQGDDKGRTIVADRIAQRELDEGIIPGEDSGLLSYVSDQMKDKIERERSKKIEKILMKIDYLMLKKGLEGSKIESEFVKDIELYKQGFKDRHSVEFDNYVDLLKSSNTEGFHDHSIDPLGRHKHHSEDALSGHMHTPDNPFGLHSHKQGGVLSGAHIHDVSNLSGFHHHDLDGSLLEFSEKGLTRDLIKRALSVSVLIKEKGDLLGVLSKLLDPFLNDLSFFMCFIGANDKLSGRDLVRVNNATYGAFLMLRDDLRFVSSVEKFHNQETQDPDLKFTIKVLNDIYSQAKGILELMNTMIPMYLEDSPEFSQQLTDSALILARFISQLPQVAQEISLDSRSLNPDLLQKNYEYVIKESDSIKGIVTGIVLEPETIDLQGQKISEEAIFNAMIKYMSDNQVIGLMHEKFNTKQGTNNPDYRIVENYIAPVDFAMGSEYVRKGTWVMSVKILNKSVLDDVLSGKLTGFSVGGFALINPEV